MTLIKHEWNQNKRAWLVWTISVGSLLVLCILIYPEMKSEMEEAGKLFSSMGAFSQAFEMDQLDFGSFEGYFSIECGNVLGLGGALFSCLLGVNMLNKEEKGHTVEFLYTHPITRNRILLEKSIALGIMIILFNVCVGGMTSLSILWIGEKIDWSRLFLLLGAYLCLQLECAGICFGISAWCKRGSTGIGIGIALMMYFLHLFANLSERFAFLNQWTPFGYCDGATILKEGSVEYGAIMIGLGIGVLGILLAFWKYSHKDLL